MKRDYFIALEKHHDKPLPFPEIIEQLAFDEKGLIPVITQDADTKSILMFAWMNKDALEKTLSTKRMTYWSRSRSQLWVKGETSGHIQKLVRMTFDCDGDAVLCQVEQQGVACHTNRSSCFYLEVDIGQQQVFIPGPSS